MKNKIRTNQLYPVPSSLGKGLLLAVLLSLLVFTVAYAANIDPSDKWAWGTNVGWLNFNPAHGGGVMVYSDHLEGYAWGENVGWIRLGSYDGGGTKTYANDAADTYGVNNDGDGNLSGYAWGTNIGWINFNPTHGQVTVDPATGDFDGYAWGENVGWIHFQHDSPAYKVNTTWRKASVGGVAVYAGDDAAISGNLSWPGLAAAGLLMAAAVGAVAVGLALRRQSQ